MSTNVTFTREQAEQMVQKVSAQAENMKSAFDALNSAAENIKSCWQGDGASAFANTYAALLSNYNNLNAIFAEGCETARKAAAMYEQGDTEATATVNGVDTQAGITPAGFAI